MSCLAEEVVGAGLGTGHLLHSFNRMTNQIAAFFSVMCIVCGLSLVYLGDSNSVGFVLGGASVLAVGLVVLFSVLKHRRKWRRASNR